MLAFICSALEKTLNQSLKLDPDTRQRLISLRGKVIQVSLTDLQQDFYLLPSETGVQVLGEYSGPIDTTICGTVLGLAKAACSGGSGTVLFDQGITIIGDIELGEKIRDILQKVDLDWEEYLSRYVGDSISHEITWRTKEVINFGRQTFQSLGNQILEFCQTEAKCLPSRTKVETFYQNIAHLRNDVDRAAARLDQLEAKVKSRKL